MNKSDLTRRAVCATPKGFGFDAAELFQQGWEAGYRAARADLRRELGPTPWLKRPASAQFAAVMKWLRPLR